MIYLPAETRSLVLYLAKYLWHDLEDWCCFGTLQEEDAKVKRAFQTLLTYVGNVARSPDEEKFRKIRLTNATFQVLHIIPSFLSSRFLCSFLAGAEDWKACISLTSAGKGWEPERWSWISSALRISEGRGWFSCYTSRESGSNVAQYCRLWAQLCHSQSFLWSIVERLQLRPWLESWISHNWWTL